MQYMQITKHATKKGQESERVSQSFQLMIPSLWLRLQRKKLNNDDILIPNI